MINDFRKEGQDMTKTTVQRMMMVLEWIHPVLLLPLVFPCVYMLLEVREDRLLLPVWVCGLSIALASFIAKTAIQKVRSLGSYLLICTGGIFLSALFSYLSAKLLITGIISGSAGTLTGEEGVFILAPLAAAATGFMSFLVTVDAFRTRMREEGRRKAVLNNDIDWVETSYLLEKPRPVFTLFHALIYLGALFTAAPVMCDVALFTGTAYLMVSFLYRYLEGTEVYLNKTENLVNVPARKIRKIGLGHVAVLLAGIAAALLLSVPFARYRTYHDVRKWKPNITMTADEIWEMNEPRPEFDAEQFWAEQNEDVPEPLIPPVFWEYLFLALSAVISAAVFVLLIRMLRQVFVAFRSGMEENGDVAESLYEEKTENKLRRREKDRGVSVKNKIRRQYIRLIRKYRKTAPAPYETPEEIESQADFAPAIDRDALHQTYEEARYGR